MAWSATLGWEFWLLYTPSPTLMEISWVVLSSVKEVTALYFFCAQLRRCSLPWGRFSFWIWQAREKFPGWKMTSEPSDTLRMQKKKKSVRLQKTCCRFTNSQHTCTRQHTRAHSIPTGYSKMNLCQKITQRWQHFWSHSWGLHWHVRLLLHWIQLWNINSQRRINMSQGGSADLSLTKSYWQQPMSSLQRGAEPYASFRRENAYMCHKVAKFTRAQSRDSHAHFMPVLVFLSPPVCYLCAVGAGMGAGRHN